MSEQMLSQEEIDALLGSMSKEEPQLDLVVLGEVLRLVLEGAFGTLVAATDLGDRWAVGQPVGALTPVTEIRTRSEGHYLQIRLGKPVNQDLFVLLSAESVTHLDALTLAEGHLARTCDAMSVSFGQSLHNLTGLPIETMSVFDGPLSDLPFDPAQSLATFAFSVQIGELSWPLELGMAPEAGVAMVEALTAHIGSTTGEELHGSGATEVAAAALAEPEAPLVRTRVAPEPAVPPSATSSGTPRATTPPASPSPTVAVRPARFADLGAVSPGGTQNNLDLLLDVPLEVTVELGRSQRTVREILELGKGAVIRLNKRPGDLFEVFVNGKRVALGEIVEVNENLGIKIREIISPGDRVTTIQ